MKFLQKGISLFWAILCICALILPAAAVSSSMEHEGLEVSVQMDKEQYVDGEPITATIIVENTNLETVTITNLEQLIPEGYQLSDNSKVSEKNVELLPGEVMVLEVTFEREASETAGVMPEDFFGKLLHGETWGLPNLLLIMVAAIAIAVFMILT